MFTENTLNSMAIMRDTSQLSWSIVPMIAIVLFVFFNEADKGNWKRILAAIAFLMADLFNELINSLICHWTEYAPVWGINQETNFQIFIGWNFEIVCGFLLLGIASTMAMPKDKHLKILGVNNRIWFIVINSALSVAFEIMLNKAGLIHWEWSWWNAQNPWLIFLIGYVPFFTAAYLVYDASISKGLKILAGYGVVNLGLMIGLYQVGWM